MIEASVSIISISEGVVSFSLDDDYDVIELVLDKDNDTISIDKLSKDNKSIAGVLRYKDASNVIIDMNLVALENIYYKDFYLRFIDSDGNVVDETNHFSLTATGGSLRSLGIVNKLQHDFKIQARTIGTDLLVFVPNPMAKKCPECWDEKLGQKIKTNCSACSDSGIQDAYIIYKISTRRIKTQTQQSVSDKGITFYNTALFLTFARLNFTLGIFMYDRGTKEFFEIKNATYSNISGIRTSSSVTAQYVPSNDSRVTPLKNFSELNE